MIKMEFMYLFSIGSGSTNCLEHYSKREHLAIGINLSAESNVGFSSENSDMYVSMKVIHSFGYVYILPVDTSKSIKIFFSLNEQLSWS